MQSPFKLDVVYPRIEGRDTLFVLPRVDSTFAFGSVFPATSRVFVNGRAAPVWKNGAFLAYVRVDTIGGCFAVTAVSPANDTARVAIPFRFTPAAGAVAVGAEPAAINRQLPVRITIAKEHACLRTTPDGAYSLFPPIHSVALADSFAEGNYRVRLGAGLHGWIEERFVTLDSTREDAPASAVSRISVYSGGKPWSGIGVGLAEPLLFRLEESSEPSCLILDIFGAQSRINRIPYDPKDEVIREIRWTQLQDDLLRLEIHLTSPQLWGYGADWIPGAPDESAYILRVRIHKMPAIERRALKDRIIILDAGHGGTQPGAIGPTRLLEKEPNLKIAMKLKVLLEREGARVFLTRSSDSTVDLYDRVDYAVHLGGEILISLHNNALSDGENPFLNRGSAVYYYQPQSRDLAWAVHQRLLAATNLPDYGFYYQNLALARPTEMLAILVECAFMIYPEEEMLLRDDQFLNSAAAGIAAGVKEYLKECRADQ